MTDLGGEIEVAAAINSRLHLLTPAEAPFAFDHSIGCVDAVNDDGHVGAAGNHDVEAAAGKGRQRRSDPNRQGQASAHGFQLPVSRGNLTDRASPKVKAKDQNAGKPNAGIYARSIASDRDQEMLTRSLPYADTVATIVMTPIAIVRMPTLACKPLLARVSQRAETTSGTAITVDSTPIPTIEPIPNSAM